MRLSPSGGAERRKTRAVEVVRPETQSELIFDPDRDVTEADWVAMRKEMERFRGNDRANFFRYPTPLLLLAPERRGELQLDEAALESFKRIMSQPSHKDSSYIRDLAVVYPDQRSEIDIEPFWTQNLRGLTTTYVPSHKVLGPAEAAVNLLLLDPKRREEIKLPPDFFEQIQQEIIRKRSEAGRSYEHRVVELALCAKLLFPEQSAGALESCETEIGLLKKHLIELRRDGRYVWFPDTLESLLFLSAERIWISPEGELKIQKPTRKKLEDRIKLPERELT